MILWLLKVQSTTGASSGISAGAKIMSTLQPHQQESGHIYLCLKSNKKQSTIKGKFYVYDHGELKTFTKRNVTMLINGDEILWKTEEFKLAEQCPFCGAATMNGEEWIHDGVECASEWDKKVKHYD